MAFTAVAILNAPSNICAASASHGPPSDYCYQTDIAFTYSGAGTVTYQPVRIEINANGMINSGQLDPRAWDLKPILGSFANEIAVTTQSLSSSSSPWWFIVPSISTDETRTVRAYSGNGEHRRDQGIFFTGGDYVSVPHDAAFSITDNLRVDFSLTVIDDTPRGDNIVEHRTQSPGEGWRISFTNSSSIFGVLVVIDGQICKLTWDSSWTGERQDFRVEYIMATGTDLFIYRNGSLATSCDIDQGTIAASSNDLVIGARASTFTSLLTGTIVHDVAVYDAGAQVGHWGFDPDSMAETVSSNPYQGTVSDYSGNGHTATYTFDRDQTDWDYTIGATQLVSGSTQITLADSNPDVLGPAFGSLDPSLTPSEVTSGIFYDVLVDKWVSLSPVRSFGYVVVLGLFGMLLALLTYKLTKQVVIALFILGFPFAIGVGNGWVPAWWLILWLVLVFGGWFAQRQAESPS